MLTHPSARPCGARLKRKKNMELKFVTEEEVAGERRGRKTKYPWAEFIEELYKHPNRWAEFPQTISNSASAYRLTERYKDIKVKTTGGNNLAPEHPDKLEWRVFIKYVQEEEVF